jgi:KUP system potassium uptake protein
MSMQNAEEGGAHSRRLAILTLTALGVVYGDIGTSPLYTIKEAFGHASGLTPTAANVYGILSLIFWSLVLVVAVKYLVFILRADNEGEGGVLALLALVLQRQKRIGDIRLRSALILLGVFGTALLYGDGIITPAISVLGAMEGLGVVAPALEPFIVMITVAILLGLFLVQRFGTAKVGGAFGPITCVWFLTIGILGLVEIAHEPRILLAIDPRHAISFFIQQKFVGFVALGAVFLAVTGAEALYADMGHFGRKPIRLAFYGLVLPALLANYFGQGALLLREPAAVENPFYLLAPQWFLYPLLLIATLAAIVASQALISGVFSLAQQAVQMGFSPRLSIIHTSEKELGQVYVPEINKALMIGTLLVVVTFRSSGALGAAYGIAVTGTMAITTILFAIVARQRWHWPMWSVVALAAGFLTFDLAFLSANALKIQHGGWVPLTLALAVLTLMTTWKSGRSIVTGMMRKAGLPMELFLEQMSSHPPPRVPGSAVFLTSRPDDVPVVLLHHLKHNQVLHEQVILLSIEAADVPRVHEEERLSVTAYDHGFYRIIARYGFMESPSVPTVLAAAAAASGPRFDPLRTSYFLGHERLLVTGSSRMWRWRKKLFVFMSRNARSAADFFELPPNRVVELGAQVEF